MFAFRGFLQLKSGGLRGTRSFHAQLAAAGWLLEVAISAERDGYLGQFAEKRVVPLPLRLADVQGQLTQVIVAPHAGFAVRNLRALRHMVPTLGLVIDRVQQQPSCFGSVLRYGSSWSSDFATVRPDCR